jgi:heme exporter protein C
VTTSRRPAGAFPKWALAYLALTLIVLAIGFDKAMTAPKEATMGNLYRVFFWHFPHTILSFVFPYLNTLASFAYLFWRNRNTDRAAAADAFALASAEVTVLYTTIGLASGMLWGRAAWGIWWAWDPRLTTYLLLWLLYVSYLLARRFSAPGQTAIVSAILGIFAAIDIPICFMSIRWWRTQHPARRLRHRPLHDARRTLEPRRLGHVGSLHPRPALRHRTPPPAPGQRLRPRLHRRAHKRRDPHIGDAMIPFHTLAERHLVYVYVIVGVLQFGYGGWLAVQWRKSRLNEPPV